MRFGQLITAFLSILAIACSSDGEDIPPTPEPDTIMLDSNLFTVDAKGGEAHITFRANKDWTIRYADDQQAVFGTLDAEKGDADDHCRIVFTMHPNTSTDRRNVVFNLTAGHAAAQVTVSQEDSALSCRRRKKCALTLCVFTTTTTVRTGVSIITGVQTCLSIVGTVSFMKMGVSIYASANWKSRVR